MPEPTLFGDGFSVNPPRRRGSPRKASDDQIRESYERTGSIHAVAKEFGMCAQSVHERVKRLALPTNNRPLTSREKWLIRGLYEKGFVAGDGQLDALAKSLGRTKAVICCWASDNGLGDPNRDKERPIIEAANAAAAESIRQKQADGTYRNSQQGAVPSPGRRMLAAWQTKARWDSMDIKQQQDLILKGMRTRSTRGTLGAKPSHANVTWKAGWREIAGRRVYFRSRWEFNYGLYLQFLLENNLITKWEHEPETFWFDGIRRGCVSYLPDFRVTNPDGSVEYHEVKGWMDPRSRTKLRRMKKYHPTVKLRVIDAKWFKANGPKLAFLKGWER